MASLSIFIFSSSLKRHKATQCSELKENINHHFSSADIQMNSHYSCSICNLLRMWVVRLSWPSQKLRPPMWLNECCPHVPLESDGWKHFHKLTQPFCDTWIIEKYFQFEMLPCLYHSVSLYKYITSRNDQY